MSQVHRVYSHLEDAVHPTGPRRTRAFLGNICYMIAKCAKNHVTAPQTLNVLIVTLVTSFVARCVALQADKKPLSYAGQTIIVDHKNTVVCREYL